MTIELTDDQVVTLRNMIQTYPLNGNLKDMDAAVAVLKSILAALQLQPTVQEKA